MGAQKMLKQATFCMTVINLRHGKIIQLWKVQVGGCLLSLSFPHNSWIVFWQSKDTSNNQEKQANFNQLAQWHLLACLSSMSALMKTKISHKKVTHLKKLKFLDKILEELEKGNTADMNNKMHNAYTSFCKLFHNLSILCNTHFALMVLNGMG